MRCTIDRFEEGFALLEWETGEMTRVPRSDLPPEAREGDRLNALEGRYVPLPEETRAARSEADDRLRRLLRKNRPS